mmetsp:Transcript_46453/g.122718  ORF Transcript_46453/g.122718 Transcript_46453/m.122718 type:complete len:520 (+) Transcript_46453:74-1633(+)
MYTPCSATVPAQMNPSQHLLIRDRGCHVQANRFTEMQQVQEGEIADVDEDLAEIHRQEDAQVDIEDGMYVAVLVAAFGGVRIPLKERGHVKIHPIFLFILCVPLLIAQGSTLFALRTDLHLVRPVYDDSPASQQLLRLKILMAMILYCMNFKMLANSVQLMFFIMNPITWVEIKNPTWNQWGGSLNGCLPIKLKKVLFATPLIAPWAFLAVGMKLLVAYLVCTDSVSVIFEADSIKEAIFNSLALAFVMDLSQSWWNCVAHVFHLSPLEEFFFKLSPERVWTEEGNIKEERLRELFFPALMKCIARITNIRIGAVRTTRTFLSRGAGARRVENFFALVVMYGICKRQLLVVLFAINTNVLPAARDVCTQYLWHQGIGVERMWQFLLHLLARRAEQMLVVDVKNEIRELEFLKANCTIEDPKFHRMTMEHISQMEAEYIWLTLPFSLALGAIFLGPHLLYAFHGTLLPPKTGEEAETIDEDQFAELDSLSVKASNQNIEISVLKQRMLDLEKKLGSQSGV